jgi:hypothetical protein
VPQLDRYLITSEIFWFLLFFLVSFFVVNFFLTSLFRSTRLRRALFLENLLHISKLKLEKTFFNHQILPRLEFGLVSIYKLSKLLIRRQKQIWSGWDSINFYFDDELETDLTQQTLINWIKKFSIYKFTV